MLQITKKQILEKWDNIPETLKEALFSDEIETIILKICQNHKLNDQQIEIIGLAIGDVLLGFLPPALLSQQLEKDGFPSDLTASISKEINEKVFAPLIEELAQIYGNTTITSQISPLSEKQEANIQLKKNEGEESAAAATPEILSPSFKEKQPSSLPKTVHYSDLRTPIEPAFTEKPLPISSLPNSTPAQINSSNIVDLKEIPVEQSPADNKEISDQGF